MSPNIGLPEMLIVAAVCCLPTAVAAALGAVLLRVRAQKKRSP
jgi:hypothetical protein